ncbi:hypothetical protein SDC9_170671 [bioreactor metagenome]|uniref:Uncharacterized protein n=1 Tax=bioreactor metagenome TaxID=1076179 RepID=A0A645GHT1_9ZZZZ
MRSVIFSIPFISTPLSVGPSANVDQHEHGSQQGQNGIELHGDAQHHALGPVVRLLGKNIDGACGHAALRNGGEQSAQRHGKAGHKILHALRHRQCGKRPAEQPHAENGKEPHHQTVQALRAGNNLKDHNLTELAGVLAKQAGARLAGNAGALCGADARKNRRQARAQQRQSQTADAAQKGQALLEFYHLC